MRVTVHARVARRADDACRQPRGQLVGGARHTQRRRRRVRSRSDAGPKGAEGQPSLAARELAADVDIDRIACLVEADTAGEEGQRRLSQATEAEQGRVLQEELALLGKEQRKASQVDALLIDLGFGEIRVDGQAGGDRRGDLVEHVDPGRELAPAVVAVVVEGLAQHEVGLQPQAEAGRGDLDAAQRQGVGQRADRRFPQLARQAHALVVACDPAFHVGAPSRRVRVDGQRGERDGDLHRPARRVHARRGAPAAVPVPVLLLAFEDHRVAARPERVDAKQVALAAAPVRVQHDRDVVIEEQLAVALHLSRHDSARLGVEGLDSNEEIRIVPGQPHDRALGAGCAGNGLGLAQVVERRGALPRGLVQHTIEAHALVGSEARGRGRVRGLRSSQQAGQQRRSLREGLHARVLPSNHSQPPMIASVSDNQVTIAQRTPGDRSGSRGTPFST